MQLSIATALSLIAAVSAENLLVALNSDIQGNVNQYLSFVQEHTDADVAPLLSLYQAAQTYTDDSYTTLVDSAELASISAFATQLPWYSSRIATAVGADAEPTASSSAVESPSSEAPKSTASSSAEESSEAPKSTVSSSAEESSSSEESSVTVTSVTSSKEDSSSSETATESSSSKVSSAGAANVAPMAGIAAFALGAIALL